MTTKNIKIHELTDADLAEKQTELRRALNIVDDERTRRINFGLLEERKRIASLCARRVVVWSR